MSKRGIIAGISTFTLLGGTAWADVTAPQIWQEMQDLQASIGATISAQSETYANGVLTLTDVRTQVAMPDGRTQGRYDRIVMRDQDDGTVRIDVSPVYAMTSTVGTGSDEIITTMELRHEGLDIVASGDATDRLYAYSADLIALETTGVIFDGDVQNTDFSLSMTDLDMGYEMDLTPTQGAKPYRMVGTGATLEVSLGFDDGTRMRSESAYRYNDIELDIEGQLGSRRGLLSGGTSLAGIGISGIAMFDYGSALFRSSFTGGRSDFGIEGRSGSGTASFEASPDRIGMSTQASQTELRLQMLGLPFPVEASVGDANFNFSLPAGASQTPQDASLSFAARDIKISDIIWGLFDPTGQLPRTPATVALDLRGTATVFGDERTLGSADRPFMGEINSMQLNDLTVDFAGAKLTGTGAVRFDNQGAVPDPIGKVDLSLTGGFELLDKLVAIGLVPQGDAAGIRMMSSMVARSVGADRLETSLEFTPNGGIIANGMQVQ